MQQLLGRVRAFRTHHQVQFPRQTPGTEVVMPDIHVDERKQRPRHRHVPAHQLVQRHRGPGRLPRVDQEQARHRHRAPTAEVLRAVQGDQRDTGVGHQPHQDHVFHAGLNLTGQQHTVPLLRAEAPALVLHGLEQAAPHLHIPHRSQYLHRCQVGLPQSQPFTGEPHEGVADACGIEKQLVFAVRQRHADASCKDINDTNNNIYMRNQKHLIRFAANKRLDTRKELQPPAALWPPVPRSLPSCRELNPWMDGRREPTPRIETTCPLHLGSEDLFP